MPAKLVHYEDNKTAVVYVRVPAWLKNLISEVSTKQGTSVNNWAANVLKEAAEKKAGLPTLEKRGQGAPTVQEVLRNYLTGSKTLEPCGRPAPCERHKAGTHRVGDFEYCNFCRIRIS